MQNTTLEDLATIIGFGATVKLSAWYGGTNVYIPKQTQEGQKLVKLIGFAAAKRLSDEFGVEHLAVPKLTGALREQRTVLIYHRASAGHSDKEIAAEVGLHERRVSQIRCELEAKGLLEKTPSKKAG